MLAMTLQITLVPVFSAQQPSAPIDVVAQTDEVSKQALRLILDGDETKARELILSTYNEQKKAGKLNGEITYFLAAFEAHQAEYQAALQHLSEASKLFEQSRPDDMFEQLLITKRLADCKYKLNELQHALEQYKTAQLMYQTMPNLPGIIKEEILESITACYMEQKNYAEAEKNALLLRQETASRLKTDPTALPSFLWAMIQLTDLYRLSNQTEKLAAQRTEVQSLIASVVDYRMNVESAGQLPSYEALRDEFRQLYVEALHPDSPAEVAWAACDFRERTPPVMAWRNNATNPIAAIICIHGLGLENRAFEVTAKDFNSRGYIVYALDVRGFGAFTQTKGVEELDFEQTIVDIGTITKYLKQKNPGMPVFVLGESMGGAIALRAGAALQDQIDGVISSVPSAERFQQKKMTFSTAVHFLRGKNKAFDVGYVTEQATSRPELRAAWKEDPKAKLRLTPIELMEFAMFMRKTKPQAEKITRLPVLIVQGLKDKLVKPEGTFALFDAVASPDKTYFLEGQSEHLMFENPTPERFLMDTVDSWIRRAISAKQPAKNG